MRKKTTDTPMTEIESNAPTAVESTTVDVNIETQKDAETDTAEKTTAVAYKVTRGAKKTTQTEAEPEINEQPTNDLTEVIISEIAIEELQGKIKSNKKEKKKMSEKEKLKVKKAKAKKKEKEKNKKAKAKKKLKVEKAKAKVKAKKKAKKSKKAKARKKK